MNRGLLRRMQLELIYRKMDLLLSGVDSYIFIYFAVTHTVLLVDRVPAVSCCSGFRWWASGACL